MSRAARLALCLSALLLPALVGCSTAEKPKPERESAEEEVDEEPAAEPSEKAGAAAEPRDAATEEQPSPTEPAAPAESEAHAEAARDGEQAGVKSIFTFRPTGFTLSDARPLTAEISLGFPTASDTPVTPESAARLRKVFRTAVEAASGADLSSAGGREELRRQLLAAARHELQTAPPSSLYFSGWKLGARDVGARAGARARPRTAAGRDAKRGGRMLLTVGPADDSGAH